MNAATPFGPGGLSTADRRGLLDRFEYAILPTLLACFFALGWVSRIPPMLAAGDDEMVYLSLSKSIDEGSYREIFQPHEPWHVQYPPLYPAWLTIVRHAVGESPDRIIALNLLLTVLALGFIYASARRIIGPGLSVALVMLAGMNSHVLATASLASEGLFLLLSAATLLWAAPSAGAAPRSMPGAVALSLMAFLTRSVGVALVIAVGFWAWSLRKKSALVGWLVPSALVVSGWFTYTWWGRTDNTVRSYTSQFQEATDFGADPTFILPLLERIWRGAAHFVTGGMAWTLSFPTIRGTVVDNILWLVTGAVLFTAGLLALWHKWQTAAIYLLFYLGTFLLWPWQDSRVLIPVVPLLFLTYLLGARWISGLMPARWRTILMGLLIALPSIGAGSGAYRQWVRFRDCDRASPSGPECYDATRLALVAAGTYLRTHAPDGSVVLTREPASLHYLTGLKTHHSRVMRDIHPEGAVQLMRQRGIQYALITEGWVAQLFRESCRDFRHEAEWHPAATLVALRSSKDGADACQPLSRFVERAN